MKVSKSQEIGFRIHEFYSDWNRQWPGITVPTNRYTEDLWRSFEAAEQEEAANGPEY